MQIDDRRSHELTNPWVVVLPPDGTAIEVIALDDGTDAADRYAGDRLFVARATVPADVELDIRIVDADPRGESIQTRRIKAPVGIATRLTISLEPPQAPASVNEPEHQGPAPGEPQVRSIRTERLAPMMAPWPDVVGPSMVALLALLGAIVILGRQLSERIVRELEALATALRALR